MTVVKRLNSLYINTWLVASDFTVLIAAYVGVSSHSDNGYYN